MKCGTGDKGLKTLIPVGLAWHGFDKSLNNTGIRPFCPLACFNLLLPSIAFGFLPKQGSVAGG